MRILTFIGCSLSLAVSAQQSTVAAGGDHSGSSGTVAYSIGQPVYTVLSSGEGSVVQGVQQPYKVTPINVAEVELDYKIDVYPNPTLHELTLHVEAARNGEEFSYRLTDLSGRLIASRLIRDTDTRIDASDWAQATYLLNVTHGGKLVQTFRIVKQ